MRRYLRVIGLMMASALCGCATHGSGSSNNTANTIAVMQATIPVAIAVEVNRDPGSVPYFRAAADKITQEATAGNYSGPAIVAAIQAINTPGKSQYAEISVLGAVAIYEAFFANQVSTNASDNQSVLLALANDIRAGLPPETLQQIKAKQQSRVSSVEGRAPLTGSPLRTVGGAIAEPFRAPDTVKPLFGKEITIGLAGMYSLPQDGGIGQAFKHGIAHGTYGLSFDTVYWFNSYFGAGAEMFVKDITNPGPGLIDAAGVTLNARYPLGPIAPYTVFAIDRDWGTGCYDTAARVGLAWRFAAGAQAFTDVGYVWQPCWSQNSAQFRLGIEFVVK